MTVFQIIVLALSVVMLGLTGYWFYLALFDRVGFKRLMNEQRGLPIPERFQYVSALILFPVMLIAVAALVFSLLAQ